MKRSFIFILLFLLTIIYNSAFAQEKIPEKPIQPDSLKMSIGADVLFILMMSLNIEGEYKTDENLGIKLGIGGGFYPQTDSSIRNVTDNINKSLFIKSGINYKFLSGKTGLETFIIGAEALLVYASHNTKVQIPHAFGTFRGDFNRSYYFGGAGFSIAEVINITRQIYLDIGPAFYLLTLENSLLSESFIPGIGPTWKYKSSETFPTMAAFLKMNLRYRF